MGFSACSDSFFDRYNSDAMQMETYLTNDSEIENIPLGCLLLSAYSTGRCDHGQRTLYRLKPMTTRRTTSLTISA